eukprot:5272422-Prymnesium_polylepis.1
MARDACRKARCPISCIRTGWHISPGRWVRHTNKTHANLQKRWACRSPLTARLSGVRLGSGGGGISDGHGCASTV